jgi:hypothetical protein
MFCIFLDVQGCKLQGSARPYLFFSRQGNVAIQGMETVQNQLYYFNFNVREALVIS